MILTKSIRITRKSFPEEANSCFIIFLFFSHDSKYLKKRGTYPVSSIRQKFQSFIHIASGSVITGLHHISTGQIPVSIYDA
ncbi:hypothetical protein DXD57_10880 [Bacteroides intestinalis]|uniref:Uncharacterized protein n=1 Tax=Bacteroides intestinalis TaxID=329854 RepID=A0A412PAT1_9BACE|nr:hypothetical protein DXK01_009900 [Bacteroides intestinalis]RGJ55682.1 hypothetical protein DXD57_10880 [Bacteroides intestinalis]RGT53525.1 hypothetical protein DWX27_08540 [Bacteroides intestinalis]